MNTEARNTLKGLAFIAPWIFGFLVFTLLPVCLSFYYSLTDHNLLQPAAFVGADNYREIARDPIFWTSLINTGYYAAVALPLGLTLALLAAVLLNTNVRGMAVYRTILYLPSLVPIVASAMLWMWLFNPNLGLINEALRAIGIVNPPGWLASTTWAMPALILMSFWGVGNTMVIFLAGLQDVPKELYEAAEIDGAGPVKQFFNVTVPMLSPVIFFNLIMGIIGTLQYFAPAFIMTSGGPSRATYFYTLFVYFTAFEDGRMGYASALAWIQLLIILALTGLAFWTSRRWVHYQGK
jgi:multiple sugar transport system permease protein